MISAALELAPVITSPPSMKPAEPTADQNVMNRTAKILEMKNAMMRSTIGILIILIGFGLVITKAYLFNSFTYGITFFMMLAGGMSSSHFQIKAATLTIDTSGNVKRPVSTVGKSGDSASNKIAGVRGTSKASSGIMSPAARTRPAKKSLPEASEA